MKSRFIYFFIFSNLYAHDPSLEFLNWSQYYRLGAVQSTTSKSGIATFARLKRTTSYTFKDLRFYGHFFYNDTEIRVRQKTSRRFLSFKRLYSFNTLMYERNTLLDVGLRYLYNQGMGCLLHDNRSGNMTLEMAIAFDNSDYLNTEQKTSYLRGAYSADYKKTNVIAKFEIDYYYQLSKKIESISLSRLQIVSELHWAINKQIGSIIGFTQDFQTNTKSSPSIFFTFSVTQPMNWKF